MLFMLVTANVGNRAYWTGNIKIFRALKANSGFVGSIRVLKHSRTRLCRLFSFLTQYANRLPRLSEYRSTNTVKLHFGV